MLSSKIRTRDTSPFINTGNCQCVHYLVLLLGVNRVRPKGGPDRSSRTEKKLYNDRQTCVGVTSYLWPLQWW